MAHKEDFWERIRSFFLKKLGVLTQFLHDVFNMDVYVQRETDKEEFVGKVDMSVEEFEKVLHDMGFDRNPLAALKNLFSDAEEYEEGSFRWVPPEDSDLNHNFQLHVILYDGSAIPGEKTGETFVFAHWEYRWDTHPIEHYNGVDASDERGVQLMRELLTDARVSYELDYPD